MEKKIKTASVLNLLDLSNYSKSFTSSFKMPESKIFDSNVSPRQECLNLKLSKPPTYRYKLNSNKRLNPLLFENFSKRKEKCPSRMNSLFSFQFLKRTCHNVRSIIQANKRIELEKNRQKILAGNDIKENKRNNELRNNADLNDSLISKSATYNKLLILKRKMMQEKKQFFRVQKQFILKNPKKYIPLIVNCKNLKINNKINVSETKLVLRNNLKIKPIQLKNTKENNVDTRLLIPRHHQNMSFTKNTLIDEWSLLSPW